MKLNKEEIYVGIAYSIVWITFQGWWGILSALLSGLLCGIGGAEGTSKNWRRIGCPLVIVLPIIPITLYIILSGILFYIVLTMGYGIPTYLSDGTCIDEGSHLGRIWWKICGGKNEPDNNIDRMATIGTRTTVALLAALCFLPLAWINLIAYIVGGLLLTVLIPIIVDKT